MAELPDDVHARIAALSERGNTLQDDAQYDEALACFREAWDLLPPPREEWEAATWLLVAIGDTLFLASRFQEAREPLQKAVYCPGGLGNPFLHLRLGQVQYELHDISRAKDELARAFMGGGDEIFEGDDPKYWRFIREILRPPRDEIDG